MRDRTWMDAAACTGMDTGKFFPGGPDTEPSPDVAGICAACPVRIRCHDYSISTPNGQPEHGVWGGLNLDARRGARQAGKRRQRRERAA